MKCQICGCEDEFIKYANEKDLYKCLKCGVAYQWPQGAYKYDDSYEKLHKEGAIKRRIQYYQDIEMLEFISRREGGLLLDVGCGSGDFIKHLPKNYRADGIDLRGPHLVGYFPHYEFKKKYDIVHMRAVLEHVKEPHAYIQKAWNVLKPGGVIAITHLPNIDNYPYMRGLIHPDEHLFYFNPKSIEFLLKYYGFKILDMVFPFYGSPYEYDEGAAFMNVLSVYAKKVV